MKNILLEYFNSNFIFRSLSSQLDLTISVKLPEFVNSNHELKVFKSDFDKLTNACIKFI